MHMSWFVPDIMYNTNQYTQKRRRGSHSSSSEYNSALQNDGNMIEDNMVNDGMNGQSMKINISTNTMINIWCMFIIFVVINTIICIHYHRNKTSVQKLY